MRCFTLRRSILCALLAGPAAAIACAGVLPAQAGQAALATGSQRALTPSPHVWIFAKAALAANDAQVAAALQRPGQTVYEVLNPATCGTTDNHPKLAGNNAVPAEHEFSGGASLTGLPSYIKAVLLDQEAWCQTAAEDKADPVKYEREMARAVASGLTFLTAPALDLFDETAGGVLPCHDATHGMTDWQCYLHYNMAGREAANAAVIDIQSQSLEANPGHPNQQGSHWDKFVSTAIDQAEDANPGVTVLVGLTDAYTSSASVLEADLSYALSQGASGAWLNEPDGDSALMDKVLKSYGIG
jgi:hypothetical protein